MNDALRAAAAFAGVYHTPPAVVEFIECCAADEVKNAVVANPPFTAGKKRPKFDQRAYYQRRKRERRCLEVCFRCQAPSLGHHYCAPCREWHNENRRMRLLIPFRNCACGAQAVAWALGDFVCAPCLTLLTRMTDDDRVERKERQRQAANDASRRYKARHKAAGLCVSCTRPAYDGLIRCFRCEQRARHCK